MLPYYIIYDQSVLSTYFVSHTYNVTFIFLGAERHCWLSCCFSCNGELAMATDDFPRAMKK